MIALTVTVAAVLLTGVLFTIPFAVGYWFASLRYRADHDAVLVVEHNHERVLATRLSSLGVQIARHHDPLLVIHRNRRENESLRIYLTKAEYPS